MMRLLLVLLVLAGCAEPSAQPHALATDSLRYDPPFALGDDGCGESQLPDEQGRCRPAEAAVVGDGGRVYWVDGSHPEASDQNPGTQARPFRTLARAAAAVRPGDGVLIRSGLYREALRPRVGGVGPGRRVTFAAYPGESVVVTGADVVAGGWQRDGTGWRHVWPESFSDDDEGPYRRELVVADGIPLRPVTDRADLQPGTFYVDGSASAIVVRFPEDRPPEVFGVAFGRRSRLFEPVGRYPYLECGDAEQPGWFRLVGLTFEHAANAAQRGAVCAGSGGTLIEDVTVRGTNSVGFEVVGVGHIVRRSRALGNGQLGLGGACTDCLFEAIEASGNNWKGFSPFWEAGGLKFLRTTGTTFRRILAAHNDGPGLWLDYQNRRNTIEDGYFFRNQVAGIELEYGTVETRVVNNVVVGTRWAGWSGSGILSQAASRNTYAHNTLTHNDGIGLWLRLDDERRAPDGHNVVTDNLIAHNLRRPDVEAREIAVEGETIEQVRTNRFAGNRYARHPEGSLRSTFFVRPEPGNPAHYRGSDLARWRALTGADDRWLDEPAGR